MPARTIKQIYENSILLGKRTFPKSINGGSLYKWRGYVDSLIIGELRFVGFPTFGLNINDESHVLPCLILNPVKNVKKLLKVYGHVVLVKDPELIVEIFVKNQEYTSVHVLIDAEKVHVVEKNILQFSLALKESKYISSRNNCNSVSDKWVQRFVPLKVSSVLLTLKSKILSLILVSLINSDVETNNQKNSVWLIFRNGQTLWKDLLLPNQIYHIVVPGNISRDYFSKYSSLTSIIDENLDVTFHQILHHKDFVETRAAIFLPEEAKIFIPSHSLVPFPLSEKWYSVSDSKLKYLQFASVFGVIREVKYFDSYKSKYCLWCSQGNEIFEATLKETPFSENEVKNDADHKWSDTFTKPPNIDEDEVLRFPDVSFDLPEDEQVTGFGVKAGKMCVQITLQGNLSIDFVSVFMKRWQLQQYPSGLDTGLTVCFTDVSIRRSKGHKIYFVCTPFSRVLHLSSDNNERLLDRPLSMQLMRFGFPCTDRHYQQIWGILELDLPLKVSIATKCKQCHHSFMHYACSNTFCPKYHACIASEFEVVASARLSVHNFRGSEMSTLYLKNENVQKYLGMPGRIWRHFCDLSANSEFCYLRQREDLEPKNMDAMVQFFHSYCKYFRPKKRFHVICKQFKNDVSGFFCLNLEEITEERVAFSRLNFEKAAEESKKN